VRSDTSPDYLAILRILRKHEVDFIVVGGVCAVLHGAPLMTFDLDVVHSREPENVARLVAALEELEATYRVPGHRTRRPGRSHLASAGHQLLLTRHGPLDVLGVIGQDRGYRELLPHTVSIPLGQRITVRALDLPTLIQVKAETAGEKDKAVLAVLRRTLAETRGSRS